MAAAAAAAAAEAEAEAETAEAETRKPTLQRKTLGYAGLHALHVCISRVARGCDAAATHTSRLAHARH